MKTCVRAVSIIATLALMAAATAQTTTWIGPPTGDWFDESNWSAGIPDSTTRAIVDVDGPLDLLIDLTPAFAQGLTVKSGQVNLQTIDALGDLRLNQAADAAPTIDVTGDGTSATVTGDLALHSVTVRDGASLTLHGRVNELREITLESGLASSALHLTDVAFPLSRPVVRLAGQFSQSLLIEDFSALDSRIYVSKQQTEQGESQIVLRRAVAREFSLYAGIGAGPSTVIVYFPSSFADFALEGANLDVTGELRVATLSHTDGSAFSFLRGDMRIRRNANVTIDDCNLIGSGATLHVEPGGRFIAQSRESPITSRANVSLEELVATGGHVYFGAQHGALQDQFSGAGFFLNIADANYGSAGLQLTASTLVVHGFLRVLTPVQIIGSEISQRGGRRRYASSISTAHSGLVFGGVDGDWLGGIESTVVNSAISARDLIVLRQMTLHGSREFTPEIRADTMWIGDGELHLIPSGVPSDPDVRIEVGTLIVGGWKRIGNPLIPRTNEQPFGALSGEGVIVGRIINSGLLDPGTSVGRIAIEGVYEQRSTLAPQAPQGALLKPSDSMKQVEAGLLLIDLMAPEPLAGHDVLIVEGDALLGGALELHYPEGEPADGDYEIVTATRIDGRFDTVDAPPLSAGRSAQVIYTPTSVIVRIGVLGDVNGDGVVNGRDIAAWVSLAKDNDPAADINGDGAINGSDLAAILGNWTRR